MSEPPVANLSTTVPEPANTPEPPAVPAPPPLPELAPTPAPPVAPSSVNMKEPLKVAFDIDRPPLQLHETIVGENADDVVKRLKDRIAPRLPFTMRLLIMPMNGLSFGQEVVRRYNDEMKTSLPIPKSCAEFLAQCEELEFATIDAAD